MSRCGPPSGEFTLESPRRDLPTEAELLDLLGGSVSGALLLKAGDTYSNTDEKWASREPTTAALSVATQHP